MQAALTALLLGLTALAAARAAEPTREELERWLEDDAELRALAVNEGELVFLPDPPKKPFHHQVNTLVLSPASLESGWVEMIQCHRHLDRVPAAQVVYGHANTRRLRIDHFSGIGRAWVEGPTVQLKDIDHGAVLCVRAESRALHRNGDGTWTLRNGPFMRRFLDGYYPMRVELDLRMPEGLLRLVSVSPPPQPGFRVEASPDRIRYDAVFEGRLVTEIRLTSRPP